MAGIAPDGVEAFPVRITLGGLFWLDAALDCLLLLVLAALAMAAVPQAKPGYGRDVLLWMGMLPVVGIGAAIGVYLGMRWIACCATDTSFGGGQMRELEAAVLGGDEAAVMALAKTVDLNRRGYAGMTLLILAAGADANLGSEYALPLELACAAGVDAVRILVDAGADVN